MAETSEHLKNLHKTINEEGINKQNYSDVEDSDENSDDEMLMKIVSKKNKKSSNFDAVAYAFKLNNKIGKLKSELSRIEERHRYIQLENNNKVVEIDQLKERITKQLEMIKSKSEIIKNNNFSEFERAFYKWLLFISLLINFIYYMGGM